MLVKKLQIGIYLQKFIEIVVQILIPPGDILPLTQLEKDVTQKELSKYNTFAGDAVQYIFCVFCSSGSRKFFRDPYCFVTRPPAFNLDPHIDSRMNTQGQ